MIDENDKDVLLGAIALYTVHASELGPASLPDNLSCDKRPVSQPSVVAIANNAVSLLSNADLLLANGRYARAMSLAVLSIEEAGKTLVAASHSKAPIEATQNHAFKQGVIAHVEYMESILVAIKPWLEKNGYELKHRSRMTPEQRNFADDHKEDPWSKILGDGTIFDDLYRELHARMSTGVG